MFNPISAVSNAVQTVTNTVSDAVGDVTEGIQDGVEAVGNLLQDAFDGSGEGGEMGPIAGLQGCCDNPAGRTGFDSGSVA